MSTPVPPIFNTPVDRALDALATLSRRYGADPQFVLAGGGNTSFKDSRRLWVKASGHALATIERDGFVALERPRLQEMLHHQWPAEATAREALFVTRLMGARVTPERGQRPSVESLLHHLLPQPFVVHTHPTLVNALTCCTHGAALAREWLGDAILWQPYVDPGLVLARALNAAAAQFRDAHAGQPPNVVLLENHGLIVAGQEPDDILRLTDGIINVIRNRLGNSAAAGRMTASASDQLLQAHAAALAICQPDLHIAADASPEIRWLVQSPAHLALAAGGALTPDQIVYCRAVPLVIESPTGDPADIRRQWVNAWTDYERRHGVTPWVGIIAGAGMLAFRGSAKLAAITRDVYRDAACVARGATLLGGVHPLTYDQQHFIETWEVEAHRRSVMDQSARAEGV